MKYLEKKGCSPARRRLAVFFFAAAFSLFFPACGGGGEQTEERDALVIMTWNLHNLFDASDSGTRYDQFRASAGWSQEKYLGRLNVMAAAIRQIEPPPDIIAVQEAGSAEVLEDLARLLPGYLWSHFGSNCEAPVGLGIISRLPLEKTKVHSINWGGAVSPRPLQEVHLKAGGQALVIFNNHWKSKVGGSDATEELRKASARVTLRRVRELAETEEAPLVIILGDLNVNHDDFFRRSGLVYALIPDSPRAAAAAGFVKTESGFAQTAGELQKDFIIISAEMPPVPRHFPDDAIVFYSPWNHAANGSYFFRGSWQTIDHFLLPAAFFGASGWAYEEFIVVERPPFTNSAGRPAPFNPRTGFGMSDHLPLLLVLRKR